MDAILTHFREQNYSINLYIEKKLDLWHDILKIEVIMIYEHSQYNKLLPYMHYFTIYTVASFETTVAIKTN
jgi:hypothetical protein